MVAMLDFEDRVLITAFCAIRALSFVFISVTLFVLSKSHCIAAPVRIIHLIVYPIIVPGTVTTFIASVYYVISNQYSLRDDLNIIVRFLQNMHGYGIRFSILFVVIERLIATAYWNTYEKSSKMKNVSITLGCLNVLVAVVYTYILVFVGLKDYVIQTVMGTSQGTCFVLAWFLIWKNYQLRERTKNIPLLSHRWQLVENIRILSFLKPFVFITTMITITQPIIGFAVPLMSSKKLVTSFSFYFTYDLYFFVCAYIFYKEYKRRRKVDVKDGPTKRMAWTSSSAHIEPVTVTTALGKSIPVKQTLDAHFNQLKDSWKV